ncbi:MAG: hypothetical protein AB1671_14120 [Thermodesulfobacteriota bacterium]
MINVRTLVTDLIRQGFQLIPRGNDALAVSPASRVTPELMELLRAYKPEILRLLRSGVIAEKDPAVLYHQDPEPCPQCGQQLWWVNIYYSRICDTCYPASSPEIVLEWLRPQGG